jgi:hypothetical protein
MFGVACVLLLWLAAAAAAAQAPEGAQRAGVVEVGIGVASPGI